MNVDLGPVLQSIPVGIGIVYPGTVPALQFIGQTVAIGVSLAVIVSGVVGVGTK